ncbi:MAG: nucleotide exchange factor GrpE [Clostridia bacterium]|nr:nucleotide exchange factor GrpE [Clostridia bacterium]
MSKKTDTIQGINADDINVSIDIDNTTQDNIMAQLDIERKNVETFKNMAIQLQADFDNYRKRNAQVTIQARLDGVADAVRALLPAYDALLGALKMITDESVRTGLQMVEREYLQALNSLDIEPIPSFGEAFDPNIHNAIMTEDAEGVDSGTVLDEIQRGFRLKNGTVIRYAIVKIAK